MHSWDCYFMSMAYFVSLKSKDPRTKIGAIIVGPDHEIRSTGFNGLPRGIKETKKRASAPLKHLFYEHAERNAIYNAARMGIDIRDCSMYTPCVPCIDCARAIIQSGIKELIVHPAWGGPWNQIWEDRIRPSYAILKEAGITVRKHKGDLITEIKGYRDGEEFSLCKSGDTTKKKILTKHSVAHAIRLNTNLNSVTSRKTTTKITR